MDEQKPEEKKEEPKQEISRDPESLIDKANNAAKRLEEANKIQADLIARQEKLMALDRLGGRSEAGQVPEKPRELTPIEYAEEVRAGKINPFK